MTDDDWISELGGITRSAWTASTCSDRADRGGLNAVHAGGGAHRDDRPRLFFFHMALAETAVLGAFMAQDLALFVVFFDLTLVPFYFLIGGGARATACAPPSS